MIIKNFSKLVKYSDPIVSNFWNLFFSLLVEIIEVAPFTIIVFEP